MLWRVLAGLLLCGLGVGPLAAADQVILVRHAEKAAGGAADPPLSKAGQARANALAEALAEARLSGILVTQFQRTRDTAAPLARQLDLPIQTLQAGGDLPAHVAEVVAALDPSEGSWLVVGHSNTISAILAGLGGPRLPDLCETSFAHVLVLSRSARGAALQRWQYGAPDPRPEGDCL